MKVIVVDYHTPTSAQQHGGTHNSGTAQAAGPEGVQDKFGAESAC